MAQTRKPIRLIVMRYSFRVLGWLAPGLAAAWAYRLWFATYRFRESEHDRRWRKQAQLQFVQHKHGRIAVYRWGDQGQPVVICLHGWNGRASQFASMLPSFLKAGYQVVAFDAPGHGQSDGKSTNIFRITDVLMSVVEPYPEIEAVVCHSFGGMVAAYAIKHLGLSPKKLIMIASPISTHYLIDGFAAALGLSPRIMRRFDRMLRRDFGDDVYERLSAEQNLKNAELPILLLYDKQDKAVNWRSSERILEAAANATAIYTEGHGHRRLLRDRKLIRKLVSFIHAT